MGRSAGAIVRERVYISHIGMGLPTRNAKIVSIGDERRIRGIAVGSDLCYVGGNGVRLPMADPTRCGFEEEQ